MKIKKNGLMGNELFHLLILSVGILMIFFGAYESVYLVLSGMIILVFQHWFLWRLIEENKK